MATLSSTVLTLSDWAKRQDPKGKTSVIAEQLSQKNEILKDMLYKEGNLPTGEQVTIRTGLPTVYYRLTNQGTPKSKSTTVQITEQAAILTARSEIDVDVAELNGDVNAFRMSEGAAFVEAMSQQQATTMIYGSAANPEEYVGLASRYSDTTAGNGDNILLGGGAASDNTSVYLVGWGQNAVHGIFPKGSMAGIQHEDLGIGDAFDSNNDRFRAYMEEWKWKHGLVVKDWRYCARAANIKIADLQTLASTQAITASTAVDKLMARLIDRLPDLTSVTPVFYVNRTVASHLRVMALARSTSALSIQESLNQYGKTIHEMRFLGIPVRITDAILNTESVVA
jgi:hypothetical protein